MRKTPVYIAAFIVGICAVICMADTKDAWRLKMNLKNGDTKTLLLEAVDSIILNDTIKLEVKPGDVDEKGEPVLMDVSYKHYYEWEWYHDNLENNTYPVVERTRTFSDGTVLTDEFRDYGHPCMTSGLLRANYTAEEDCIDAGFFKNEYGEAVPKCVIYTPQDYILCRDNKTLFAKYDVIDGRIPTLGERYVVNSGNVEIIQSENELSYNITHSIGVDYLNGIFIRGDDAKTFYTSAPYGQWNKYIASKIYKVNDEEVMGSTGLPFGWYFQEMLYRTYVSVLRKVDWAGLDGVPGILSANIDYYDYDQYFVDELKMIDFLYLKANAIYEPPTLERAVSSRGNCMIFKVGVKTEKCGITQNVSITDTIYEIKYSNPILRYITPLRDSGGRFMLEDFNTAFVFDGGCQSFTMISSLQPNVQVMGEGYSVEIIDLGEEPNCTNRSLPFHNWEIVIKSEENLTEDDRYGTFSLLDAYEATIQTINLLTDKKPEWYEEE